MSWAVGYDDRWKRWIGYGVPSVCDHPGCKEEINRGLGYVCGREPYGGEYGCGLFFCGEHEQPVGPDRTCNHAPTPSPDTDEWLEHQRTDPSWAEWRLAQEVLPFDEVAP